MRYIILIALLMLTCSCKKSIPPSASISTLPTFQFMLNGTTVYQMNGNRADSTLGAIFVKTTSQDANGNTYTHFYLEATDTASDGFGFDTGPTPSLTVGTYINKYTPPYITVSSVNLLLYNFNLFDDERSGDSTTIVITDIHDNLADGTFSGLLTQEGNDPNPTTISITNGQFKNISIKN